MNTRLQQFLAAENLSQAQFADNLGVARASVSHILAARNNPGYDFILSIIRHYPSLNIEWLLTGKGKMYRGANETKAISNQTAYADDDDLLFHDDQPVTEEPNSEALTSINTLSEKEDSPVTEERKAVKVIVFYNDGTFQEFKEL